MSKAGAFDLASGLGGKIAKDDVLSAVDKYFHRFLSCLILVSALMHVDFLFFLFYFGSIVENLCFHLSVLLLLVNSFISSADSDSDSDAVIVWLEMINSNYSYYF